MKILVACDMPEAMLAALRALGTEVTHCPRATGDELKLAVKDAAILIVGRARVSPEIIAAAPVLQMIVRRGSGVSNIALEDASREGVFVTHCPGREAAAVAELGLGLIVALDRGLVEQAHGLRDGDPLDGGRIGQGLVGRTLGVYNYDAVGIELASRAQSFGMKVTALAPGLAADPTLSAPGLDFYAWPRELARQSDVIFVHAPPDESEETWIDGDFLSHARRAALLVHIGRPSAIDPEALASAVEQKQLRVAIDILSFDPSRDAARFKWRLLDLPGVIATHRLATRTCQAREATAAEAVEVVRRYLVSGEVRNCVNLAERSPATWQLVLRLRDTVGVMASVMDAIRADGINAEEITCRVFSGAQAAWCVISLDERPSTESLAAIGAIPGVIHLELRAVV
jgi:D-3-phosphoglycerate dehydrogenase